MIEMGKEILSYSNNCPNVYSDSQPSTMVQYSLLHVHNKFNDTPVIYPTNWILKINPSWQLGLYMSVGNNYE